MIWALGATVIILAAAGVYALTVILRELRVYHQAARARVNDLESERTSLIQQVAESRGVALNDPTDPLGLSKPRPREFAIDPQTGNTLYADGTVVGADGSVLLEPGDEPMTAEEVQRVL